MEKKPSEKPAEKKPSAKAEALARQLQEKLQHQRPRWYRWAPLVVLIVLFSVLAVLAWWHLSGSEPPRLEVTALDMLATTEEPATVAAALEPKEADAKPPMYRELEITFWEEQIGGLDTAPRKKAASNDQGVARTALEAASAQGTPFYARHLNAEKKYETKDRAHVFAWPKDASILLVEVEETLVELDPAEWTKTNPINIAARPGAAAALRAAREKGWHVAYLALHPAQAKEYRRVRGWVENKGSGTDVLPRGPVLFWAGRTGESASQARNALLQDLRDRFTGSCAAVVRTADAAEQCRQHGVRPLAMGGGDFADGIARLKSWADLPTALGP